MATPIKALRQGVRRQLNAVSQWRGLYQGYQIYKKTGDWSEQAGQNIINLYCGTHGRSSEFLHGVLKKRHPVQAITSPTGVLGALTPAQISQYAATIERDGYCMFPNLLPPDTCDRLEKYARITRTRPTIKGGPEWAVYDSSSPIAPTYKFEEQDLVDNSEIQKIITDESLLAVAQAYLQLEPVFDLTVMWWSVPFGEASSAAAQLYHFDMDRLRWLKFFFYLTDVTTDTGPHCFVRGSANPKNQPKELLDRGYVRISDEDMQRFYKPEDFVEICGKRGSIMAVDTRGFHKGKPLTTGERLILQTEYADSLLGSAFMRPVINFKEHAEIYAASEKHPRVFSKFTKKD